MEHKVIALEEGLSRFKRPLEEAGFSTVEINRFGEKSWQNADMVMISGQNDNLMGIQTIEIEVPVINVAGLSAERIIELARDRLE